MPVLNSQQLQSKINVIDAQIKTLEVTKDGVIKQIMALRREKTVVHGKLRAEKEKKEAKKK